MITRYKVLIGAVVGVYAVLILFWVMPLQPDTLKTQLDQRNLSLFGMGGTLVILNALSTQTNISDEVVYALSLFTQGTAFILIIYSVARWRSRTLIYFGSGLLLFNCFCGSSFWFFVASLTPRWFSTTECVHSNGSRFHLIEGRSRESDFRETQEYVFFATNINPAWQHIYTLGADFLNIGCEQIGFYGSEIAHFRGRTTFVFTTNAGLHWQEWSTVEVDLPSPDWCWMVDDVQFTSITEAEVQLHCYSGIEQTFAIVRTDDGGQTWQVAQVNP